MNLIDIILVFLLIYFSHRGYKKGLIISLVSFFSFFTSILIALNFSSITSNILLIIFPSSEKLVIGLLSVLITFFLSAFLIKKITSTFKDIIDMTPIGIIDDIVGALFGCITTCLIISFTINLMQYFDLSFFEEEIKKSILSNYLLDFAPNALSLFKDFFPSLEIIVKNSSQKTLNVYL